MTLRLMNDDDREFEAKVNRFLKACRSSFKNVEGMTDNLLTQQPVLAAAMFVGAGLAAAYVSGFFFLEGYIDSWNPVENDQVPYWNEELSDVIESTATATTTTMLYLSSLWLN